ncbi:MAG: hypothetical protein RL226_2233 [Bacteroidota bacterium]
MINWILAAVIAFSPASEITTARKLYLSVTDEDAFDTFNTFVEPFANHSNPLLQGYSAVALSMSASYSYNPYTKLKAFNQGRDRLENVIKLHPNQSELRFLRLGVQIHAPSFLDYNDNIEADSKNVLKAVCSGTWKSDPTFEKAVIAFLKKHAPLSKDELLLLNQQDRN